MFEVVAEKPATFEQATSVCVCVGGVQMWPAGSPLQRNNVSILAADLSWKPFSDPEHFYFKSSSSNINKSFANMIRHNSQT